MSKERNANVRRQTGETDIELEVVLDGEGQASIDTPVPFLSHMLDLFTKHSHFDIRVQAAGDVDVDDHHTTEDVGICLGQVIHEALGDKKGIRRYGHAYVPMDDALVQVVVDLSNRPHLEFRGELGAPKVGTFDTELVREFLWKFAVESRMNLHVIVHYGWNTHHIIEAIFKALARALADAVERDPRVKGIPSTKGML
ncbi:imidazoleglycerol-phosphate dehydratase [Geomicrobium halophilum]|uniref:Imidazoleglycerol-phosphate dehydratase n=1 Tax=Geomicrobium halophilum TaxID=549000 RepID=A0A841PNB1_9BACL|nr:imidazoleglycerol-phosphate dehydratase HisB [Geomicrobium halophilum]MBB6450337.1 imidazoleglycerol-phosphate dehydratase [Geomicrobium halophilum]